MKFSPDELITQAEAARLRGVTHQSIAYLIKQGRVRTVVISGKTFIIRKDIENYEPGRPGRPRKNRESTKKTRKRRSEQRIK